MNCSVTDIGSNTVKITVYRIEENVTAVLENRSRVVGLAKLREGNILPEKGIAALCEVLDEYRVLACGYETESFYCIATAGLRGLDNLDDVIGEVKKRTGCEIEILSGEREAELSYKGFVSSLVQEKRELPQNGIYLDMGGASTELVSVSGALPGAKISMPIGSLKLFSGFVINEFPTETEEMMLRSEVRSIIDRYGVKNRFFGKEIYATGGTVKAIGRVISAVYGRKYGNFAVYSPSEIAYIGRSILKRKDGIIKAVRDNADDRVHLIVPGLIILSEIAEVCKASMIYTVYSGIRDGFVSEIADNGRIKG